MSASIGRARGEIAGAWGTICRATGYGDDDPHMAGTPERVARFFTDWHTVGREPPKLTLLR